MALELNVTLKIPVGSDEAEEMGLDAWMDEDADASILVGDIMEKLNTMAYSRVTAANWEMK